MIYFITNKIHNIIISPDNEEIKILNSLEGRKEIFKYIYEKLESNNKDIGIDKETNGLDAYKNDILLVIIGDKDTKFVIDFLAFNKEEWISIFELIKDILTFLGHNIKFDWKFLKIKTGIELKYLYDTMIVEQRLYPNYFDINNKPFALDSVVYRYFGIIPKEMDKTVRNDFINANKETFIFQTKHILYAAKDIEYLFDIKVKQEVLIKKWNLEFLINEIELPLIKVLAESELEGFKLNQEKWQSIIDENENIKFQKEKELDDEIRRLRFDLPLNRKLYLIGGKFDRMRIRHPKQINEGLFGEPVNNKALYGTDKPVKENLGNINYGSSTQIIDIFARLEEPLPTKHDKYEIPKLKANGKVDDGIFTTGEDAIECYLIDNPNSKMKNFIKTLIDFREATTQLNTFGQSFLDYINPITEKIHTIYRQCSAVNGRLQSGNTKEGCINIQNIPAQKKFRESFGTDEGYSIVTIDLSGAEVTVMADKANDTKLFELAMKGDIHSTFAQAGWRNIFQDRANRVENFDMERYIDPGDGFNVIDNPNFMKPRPEWIELQTKASHFIVSKTENAETHRKPCKNLSFGVIYGCHKKKAGRTINVSADEGQIYINTIKKEIPKTIKMVENNVQLALKQGYLILNTRTNSRIWFPKVINSIRNKSNLDFMDKIEVDGQARNTPISGTQADMIKESMVVIYNYIKENKIDSLLLAQVHDELLYKIPDSILEWFPHKIKELLLETSNKYLTNIKIEATMEVKKVWTK